MAEVMAEVMAKAMAEANPRTGMSDHVDAVRFTSAGVAAADGLAMHPLALEVLAGRSLSPGSFRSSHLRTEHVERADLVLTATREHRARCVSLAPRAVRRCFTLRQLSRIAAVVERDGLSDGGGIAGLLAAAPAARGRIQSVSADEDDLADPVLLGIEAFEQCADDIAASLAPILRLIAAP